MKQSDACLVVVSWYLRQLRGCLASSDILTFASLRTSSAKTSSTYPTSCPCTVALPWCVVVACPSRSQSLLQVFAPQAPAPSAPAPRFPGPEPPASPAASQPWGGGWPPAPGVSQSGVTHAVVSVTGEAMRHFCCPLGSNPLSACCGGTFRDVDVRGSGQARPRRELGGSHGTATFKRPEKLLD